jgi:MAP/microtubule affinity-regulating kinase
MSNYKVLECSIFRLPAPIKNSETTTMSHSKPISKLGKVKIDLGNKPTSRS